MLALQIFGGLVVLFTLCFLCGVSNAAADLEVERRARRRELWREVDRTLTRMEESVARLGVELKDPPDVSPPR